MQIATYKILHSLLDTHISAPSGGYRWMDGTVEVEEEEEEEEAAAYITFTMF